MCQKSLAEFAAAAAKKVNVMFCGGMYMAEHTSQLTSVEFETVEKVAKPLFRAGLHAIFNSISCEIVLENCVRSVISEAHVPENDGFYFDSIVCGRWNSLQEGFFDKLRICPYSTDKFCARQAGILLEKVAGHFFECMR